MGGSAGLGATSAFHRRRSAKTLFWPDGIVGWGYLLIRDPAKTTRTAVSWIRAQCYRQSFDALYLKPPVRDLAFSLMIGASKRGRTATTLLRTKLLSSDSHAAARERVHYL
jgi:hypothetical protein